MAGVSVRGNIATSEEQMGVAADSNNVFVRSTVLPQGTQERNGSCHLENVLVTVSYQELGCPINSNKKANKHLK